MNHFSNKTKPARTAINEMKVILQKFKGDTTVQDNRLAILDDLVNYTVLKEVECNELENTNARLIMIIGGLRSQLTGLAKMYNISEKVNERSVDEVVKEFMDRFELQLTGKYNNDQV